MHVRAKGQAAHHRPSDRLDKLCMGGCRSRILVDELPGFEDVGEEAARSGNEITLKNQAVLLEPNPENIIAHDIDDFE